MIRTNYNIEITTLSPLVAAFNERTVFTFAGSNLMELTSITTYCTLGSARHEKFYATVVDQSSIECAVNGPKDRLSDALMGLEATR